MHQRKKSGSFSATVPSSGSYRFEPSIDKLPSSPQSKELFDKRQHARTLRNKAEGSEDLKEFVLGIARGIRSEQDIQTRTYLAEAARHLVKTGRHTEQLLPALASALDCPDMNIRYNSVLSFAYYAENQGDIFEYLRRLTKTLDDISASIREASLRAFNSYIGQNEIAVTNVLDSLSDFRQTTPVCEVRAKCMELLEDGGAKLRITRLEALLIKMSSTSLDNSAEAFAELDDYARTDTKHAYEVLTLLDRQNIHNDMAKDLRKTCLDTINKSMPPPSNS